MMRTEHGMLVVVSSLVLVAAAPDLAANEPEVNERNYWVIVERNPFGLKPPPPPPTNAPPVAASKDEIFLTGITSIGKPRAYFMTAPKSPQAKQPEYYCLGVEDKKNDLEVLEIDLSRKSVRVRNAGVETVMTFASNGVKPPAAPAAAPSSAAPGAPRIAGVPALPGTTAAPGVAAVPPGMNVPSPASATIATPGTISPITPGTSRVRTIPSRSVRTSQAVTGGAQMMAPDVPMPVPAPVAAPDPDAAVRDALMIELQKRAHPDVSFPPTPLPP